MGVKNLYEGQTTDTRIEKLTTRTVEAYKPDDTSRSRRILSRYISAHSSVIDYLVSTLQLAYCRVRVLHVLHRMLTRQVVPRYHLLQSYIVTATNPNERLVAVSEVRQILIIQVSVYIVIENRSRD